MTNNNYRSFSFPSKIWYLYFGNVYSLHETDNLSEPIQPKRLTSNTSNKLVFLLLS